MLYNFKQQHPEADIEPFLEKTSQFFQEYIEKGLKKIEEQRNNNKVTEDNSQNTEKILYEIGNCIDLLFYFNSTYTFFYVFRK